MAAWLLAAAAVAALLLLRRERAERASARQELLDVQARVGGIVESAMDAIVTVNEEQRVLQFNAAAERVFRWPRAAVLGEKVDMLMPERFRGEHAGHIRRFGEGAGASRGMGAQRVLRGLKSDGTEFPIEASISRHVEEGRQLFTVILRDVTERVRNEGLLAENEARLRGILDSAMDAIITVDESQHILLFNAAAEAVFRCKREEAVGAPLVWFIPERFRAGHGELVRRFGAEAGAARRMGQARVVAGLRRTGEEFPIEASISQAQSDGRRFFTVILRDVTERVQREVELRRSREEIHELALAASAAREREQSRIARELHDELGQALTALKLDLSALRGGADEALAAKLSAMQGILDATVAATRRIAADLRPLMLDDLGLAAAVEWLAESFAARSGIACEITLGTGDLDLPDPYATTVFRVLQESLTNVAKHAQARHVEVVLERDAATARLTVHDDGRGFDAASAGPRGSYGLVGLRERALLAGGSVAVRSSPGAGTTVELVVPLPPSSGA